MNGDNRRSAAVVEVTDDIEHAGKAVSPALGLDCQGGRAKEGL
ncbi:MAG: hypothetical protein Q8P67_20585 [archaeon]|nr:hypothetical protein [archaeon]